MINKYLAANQKNGCAILSDSFNQNEFTNAEAARKDILCIFPTPLFSIPCLLPSAIL